MDLRMVYILALYISYSCGLCAQIDFAMKPTIKVVCTDSVNLTPLENVNCFLYTMNDTLAPSAYCASDSLGMAQFKGAYNIPYRLVASFLGKIVYQEEFVIDAHTQMLEKAIRLNNSRQLGEVIVKASSIKPEKGKMIFYVQHGGLGKSIAMYTAYDALARIPRIQVTGKQVLIDGKPAEIRINGIKKVNANDQLSLINAADISKIEVVFGRTASSSGEAAGGVVNVYQRIQTGITLSAKNTLSILGKPFNCDLNTSVLQNGNLAVLYGNNKWQAYAHFSTQNGTKTGLKHHSTYEMTNKPFSFQRSTIDGNLRSNNCIATFGASGVCGQHRLSFEIENNFTLNDKKPQENEFFQGYRTDKYAHYTANTLISRTTKLSLIQLTHLWTSKNKRNTLQTSINYLYDKENESEETITNFILTKTTRKEDSENRATNKLFFVNSELSSKLEPGLSLNTGIEANVTNRTSDYIHETDLKHDDIETYGYRETLTASFFSLSKSWKQVTITCGLRLERTSLHGKKQTISQRYSNWLPSFLLSYTLSNSKELVLSYSRYLFRPSFDLLTNYKTKVNDFLYFVGNPLLKTQETDEINLSYTNTWCSLSAAYRVHHKVIEENFFVSDSVICLTNQNMLNRHEFSINLGSNNKPFSFWNLSTNFGIQYIYIPDGYLQKDIVQGYVSLHNTLKLTSNIEANINMNGATPWIMQTRRISGRLTSQIGTHYISKNNKWVIGFLFNNLIRKNHTSTWTTNPFIANKTWTQSALRSFMLTISYRFKTSKQPVSPLKIHKTENRARL